MADKVVPAGTVGYCKSYSMTLIQPFLRAKKTLSQRKDLHSLMKDPSKLNLTEQHFDLEKIRCTLCLKKKILILIYFSSSYSSILLN